MKAKIERCLTAMTRLFFRHPWKTLLLVLTLFGLSVNQLPTLTIDMSPEALLHENDPYRVGYDQFRSEFGQDRIILLTITTPDLFNEPFFLKLRDLTREIEAKVPYMKKVHSLITVRDIWGDESQLRVDELLEDLSVEPIDYAALKEKVLRHRFYQNHLISTDGNTTAVIIETEAVIYDAPADIDAAAILDPGLFDPDTTTPVTEHYINVDENHAVVENIYDIISSYQSPDFKINFSGTPVVMDIYNQVTRADMAKCSLILLAVIVLFLFSLFRRLFGIFMPLIIVIASYYSAMGLMAFSQVPVKIMSSVLPTFILSVGIADAVHILTHFFVYLQQGCSKEEAVVSAVRHSGVAVLLTSLTTAAGLLSFSFVEMAAVSEMGIFAAVGVVFALFYTLAMTPAMISLLPLKPKKERKRQSGLTDRILSQFGRLATTRPKAIVVVTILLLMVSGALLSKLRFSDHVLKYFPDDMRVKQDTLYIQDKLNGLLAFEIIVDTGEKNGLYEPAALNRIEDAIEQLKQIEDPVSGFYVGNVISIIDLVKEINQALNNNDPRFYSIAQDRETVAQELFLFELSGADDLRSITDSDFSRTRISVKVPWLGSVDFSRIVQHIDQVLTPIFKDEERFSMTGMSVILARTYPATLNSMYHSYLVAFVVISLMLILLVGGLRIGLASIVPNILPIMLVMGSLTFFGITLDMTSMMIGSIALGLVVDDSLHFIYSYRRFLMQSGDPDDAVRQTLQTSGRALLITSVVLACGFLSLLNATLLYLVQFGLLLALIIVLALLADFLVLPAILVLCTGNRERLQAVSKSFLSPISSLDRTAKPSSAATLVDPP
jgi:predicted RND superfamily exporter protein